VRRIDALLSARGVWLFWLTYSVCFAVIRYVASGNLSKDDARENELVQAIALGYQTRQPPLFEWILWGVQQGVGTGIVSHLLVRYVAIVAIGLAAYAVARAITGDARWAAAASMSYAFTGFFGWVLHEWLTQSLLVSIACIVSLGAMLTFLHKPSTSRALVLGVAIGFGLMSKFNYLLYLGGLVLAVASRSETRARLADRRLLLSCVVAAACCVPYLWWLTTVHGDLVGMTSHVLGTSEKPHLIRALLGLGSIVASLVDFFSVGWILLAVLGWPAFYPPHDRRPAPSIDERIAGRAVVMATALAAISIALVGASKIETRYVCPLLATVPIWACARIARLAPEPRRLRRIAATAVSCAALLFAVRVLTFFDTEVSTRLSSYRVVRDYREFTVPYDGLAAELEAHGVTGGTLVAAGIREAGNMRAYLPDLRVISGDSSRIEPPPRRAGDRGGCVFLWKDDERDVMRRWAQHDLASAVRLAVTTSTMWGSRHGVWYLLRADPRSPICA